MVPAPLPPSIGPVSLTASTTPPTVEEAVPAPVSMPDYAEAAAQRHGIDPIRFKHLVNCESQWKEDAQGDHGTSFGILQFKEHTFSEFTKKYSIEGADISDAHDQLDLAAQMISDGYLQRWKNCARKTGWTAHVQQQAQKTQPGQQLVQR